MLLSYLSHGAPLLDKQSDSLMYGYDPAIQGYFGIYFEHIEFLDTSIFETNVEYALNTKHDIRNPRIVKDCLTAYCIAIDFPEVTLDTINLKTVQFHDIILPKILSYGGQSITLKLYDTSTGILFRFFRNWLFALRAPDKYWKTRNKQPTYLKCNAIVFLTDPTFTDISLAFGLLGLMPTSLPSGYSIDTSSRNISAISQPMKFDKVIFDDHIWNYAKDRLLPMFIKREGIVQWAL